MAAGREYRVAGKTTLDFDRAAGRAVALSIARKESVCIETVVRGQVVEMIDVTAALSIDTGADADASAAVDASHDAARRI
jgi:hypothetical protein